MSNELHKLAVEYFRAPANYYWKWVEDGSFIESGMGKTIVHVEDLMHILEGLVPHGLPPLSAILLVLYGAKFGQDQQEFKREHFSVLPPVQKDPEEHHERFGVVAKVIKMLAELPEDLRTGDQRITLIHDLLGGGKHLLPTDKSVQILDLFRSGAVDQLVFKPGRDPSPKRIKRDVFDLNFEGQFLTSEMLELRLRTGVEEPPEALELPLPEPPPTTLLQELERDSRTEALARLTRRIIAALFIPLHTRGSSDQSYGGVSDITNRGDFDRLLISELAYDDTTLLARLANNEALYLRREEPPSNIERERTILVDTTLKMWGITRLFAFAAALACAQEDQNANAIHAFALNGKMPEVLDLESREGVVKGLEKLDTALDCSTALSRHMALPKGEEFSEVILITGASYATSAGFLKNLSELKRIPHYLITVDRDGTLKFFELIDQRRKLLRVARFDLPELLKPKAKPRKKVQGEMPAIYLERDFPLYYPSLSVRLSPKTVYHSKAWGVVVITEDRRLLLWPEKGKGAIEVADYVPHGTTYLGLDEEQYVYVVVLKEQSDTLEFFGFAEGAESGYEERYWRNSPEMTVVDFVRPYFIITSPGSQQYLVIDCDPMEIIDEGNGIRRDKLFQDLKLDMDTAAEETAKLDFNYLKRHINHGYSVLKMVSKMGVTADGQLFLDGWVLTNENRDTIKLKNAGHRKEIARVLGDRQVMKKFPGSENPALECLEFVFPEGSVAMLDPKGFLHLRSSHPDVLEVTLVMVLGKSVAGWAANGETTGHDYFVRKSSRPTIKPHAFYAAYIQPFIDQISEP